MAMEMHVFSERRLNSMAEWQRAVDLEGYPLKFAPDARLETVNGFLPCRLRERETGFECYHDDAQRTMENYGRDSFHSQWKYALGFRWRGDFTELQAAWMTAAAYARATNGIVFDPEAGRSYSPQEAVKVVSDNERELPAVEEAVRAAIEKLTKKA
jgi:hypothetical protein